HDTTQHRPTPHSFPTRRSSDLYSNQNLSASNLTPALIAQGLNAVNGLKRSWDFNPSGGGRLVRDKLWFYGAYRNTEVDKNLSRTDRKSTRLNSSHGSISYAVFC